MLVLLGPDFDGAPASYDRLARLTGFVVYDLKARLRPGVWGVVRTLADATQAEALGRELANDGFEPVLVNSSVAHDADRRIVHARGVALADTGFVAQIADREMGIEYAAIACVVQGEVQPGRSSQRTSASSAKFRAVTPAGEPASSWESQVLPFEAYQAADVHFLSVPWILRIDARQLALGTGDSSVRVLDALADDIARRAGARIDRGVRISSVATFAEQTVSMRNTSAEPPSRRDPRQHPDDRFDPYSRLIGEAERSVRLARNPG